MPSSRSFFSEKKKIFQRGRQLRGAIQEQRAHLSERRRPLGPTGDLPEFLHHRRHVLPVRPANLHHEIRFLDVQRRPSLPGLVQQQELRRPVRLLEERHLGHHQRSGLHEHLQRRLSNRDRHHLLHNHQTQNPVLHSEPDPADRAHLFPMRARVLPSSRGRRESDSGDQYPPLIGRVPVTGQQDPATDLVGAPVDRQVSPLHVHHEHGQHPSHGDHHQLELPRAEDPQNASIDQEDILEVSANYTDDEEAQEDASQVDDGDSKRDVAHFHLLG